MLSVATSSSLLVGEVVGVCFDRGAGNALNICKTIVQNQPALVSHSLCSCERLSGCCYDQPYACGREPKTVAATMGWISGYHILAW